MEVLDAVIAKINDLQNRIAALERHELNTVSRFNVATSGAGAGEIIANSTIATRGFTSPAVASGEVVQLDYSPTSHAGFLTAYDWGAGAYKTLIVRGNPIQLTSGDVNIANGLVVGNTTTDPAADDLYVDNDGRFGGGLWVGAVDSDPTAGRVTIEVSDAGTNNQTANLVLYHNTSDTPAAGFGSYLLFGAQSTTTENRAQATILTQWVDATDATRKGRVILNTYDTNASPREIMRGEATGTAPAIGFLGAAASARRAHVANPTDLATCITAINAILVTLETFGFHATS